MRVPTEPRAKKQDITTKGEELKEKQVKQGTSYGSRPAPDLPLRERAYLRPKQKNSR